MRTDDEEDICSLCERPSGLYDEADMNRGRCPETGGRECREVGHVVASWRSESAALWAKAAEADRLRKLFEDAGQGEHNVLALIDHYQRNSMDADGRLRTVRKLLEENGCDCPGDHHWVCLACRIGEAVGK